MIAGWNSLLDGWIDGSKVKCFEKCVDNKIDDSFFIYTHVFLL